MSAMSAKISLRVVPYASRNNEL